MGNIARNVLASADEILVERGEQYGDADMLFSNMAVRFGLVLGICLTVSGSASYGRIEGGAP